MRKLAIQAIKVENGTSGIKTMVHDVRADDDRRIVTEGEITVDEVVDMLHEHLVDSKEMRDLIAAYKCPHNRDEKEQTWVVRHVDDFGGIGTRFCEIKLLCGFIDGSGLQTE